MNQELYEMEFYYDDSLIGRGYNLTERQADQVWTEWEEFGENYWCVMIYNVNGFE